MKHHSIVVRAQRDQDADSWVASSHGSDGWSVDADTAELLHDRRAAALSDLVEPHRFGEQAVNVSVPFVAESTFRIAAAVFAMSGGLP